MSERGGGVGALVARAGFLPSRLGFTLRTGLAALCAIALAQTAGLEHPQWAGMTVWAASMPVRGHLIERSLFRALGTVVGAAAGVVLLLAADAALDMDAALRRPDLALGDRRAVALALARLRRLGRAAGGPGDAPTPPGWRTAAEIAARALRRAGRPEPIRPCYWRPQMGSPSARPVDEP